MMIRALQSNFTVFVVGVRIHEFVTQSGVYPSDSASGSSVLSDSLRHPSRDIQQRSHCSKLDGEH